MLSVQARMLNQIFKNLPAEDKNMEHDYVKERETNRNRELPKKPKGITVELKDFNGIDGEIIFPENPDSSKVIWFVHGGGCTTGTAMESRD